MRIVLRSMISIVLGLTIGMAIAGVMVADDGTLLFLSVITSAMWFIYIFTEEE